MSINRAGLVHAAASVVGATGAVVKARDCAVARTGAGVYTVTVADIDAADAVIVATVRGAADVALKVAHTSDTVKTVSSVALAAGQAATDSDFDIIIFKISSGDTN